MEIYPLTHMHVQKHRPGLDLLSPAVRGHRHVWEVCSSLSRPPAETVLADRWSCFWPLGSKSGLLKGCGTLSSPLMLPWCRPLLRGLFDPAENGPNSGKTALTAWLLSNKGIFVTGFTASSVVINTMPSILSALQREAAPFSHPPFYPLKIIFRVA